MKANLQRKGSTPRHVVLELVDVAAAMVMVVLVVVLVVALIVVVIACVTQVGNGRKD